jgi:VWFA-related protein
LCLRFPLFALMAAVLANPAQAAIDLRIQAAPVSDPIQAFVTVTDGSGNPVGGLTAGSFTLTLDGATVQQPGFSLPPNQNPDRKVSVVFVLDYSVSVQNAAKSAMEQAVTTFINSMDNGDYAAIIKFNNTNPSKASVVQAFTQIDGASGDSALLGALAAEYPGNGTNLLDALDLALNQFTSPTVTLPAGPKAIILLTDGGENSSTVTEGAVNDKARAQSIPIFTVGVSTILRAELLQRLATLSGGEYLPSPNDAAIAQAYSGISNRLNNEYLLTIQSSITDCNQHTLTVTVAGQSGPVSETFVRCGAAPTPPPAPSNPSTGGGGGGGGALGVLELLAGLLVLAAGQLWRSRKSAMGTRGSL